METLNEHGRYLINAGIDGELTPAEQVELEELLRDSAEARAMQTGLRRLANVLDSQPDMQPPDWLSDRILDQVALPVEKPGFRLTDLFASLHPAASGLAFAAGLLLTIAFYEFTPRQTASTDTAGMIGTMMLNPQQNLGSSADSLAVDVSGVSGSMTLQSAQGVYILVVDLVSDKPYEIEVAFANAGLGFGGLANGITGNELTDESIRVSGGTVRVENQGRQAFHIFLPELAKGSKTEKTITVDVSSLGTLLFSGVLQG
jgi:hypothetical protein